MSARRRTYLVTTVICSAILIWVEPAHAYGGPGSVISGLGTLLAVVVAIVAALFGFVWYPVKRLLRTIRGTRMTGEAVVPEPDEKIVRE